MTTLEEFESEAYRNGYRCGYSAGVAATFNPKLRWISVKDRLPENDEYVLTYCDCSTKSVRTNWYSTHRKAWHEGDDNITHWQPLPEDPKGDENEIV